MFKALRDRLKGVSKKLEDEVEKQLGDKLEQELAVAMAKPVPAPTPAAPAPAPAAPAPSAPAPPPRPAPPVPPAAPKPVGQPLPEPRPAQPTVPSPAAPAPKPTPVPLVNPPTSTPTQPAPPGAPQQPVGAASATVQQPHPAPQQPKQQPAQAKPQPAERTAPKANVTGRKMLSEDEIASRLERELGEAVAVQKAVETVVQTVAPATRFTINEQVLEDILWDLEVGLLESDVALPVIEAIKASVKEQILTLTVGGKPEEVIETVLRTAIKRVLQVNPLDFDQFIRERLKVKRPVVVMFVGVNGTGKTTSIGRLAYRLKEQGLGVVLAAGDTFRAGAIEQLALHGERLGVTVIKHKAGADPAAVAYDAIEHAKARQKEVVLLDTAGRMQNNSNLMDEMDKIRRVANPDLCVFVGDSLAGNDAVEQARKFDEIVDVGGVILTKVDVDAKGGAALSVAYTINKPLLFVGVGQDYPDLKPFDAEWLVNRLFGDEAEAPA
ncbi:MAG: signal recognition particle-docking protein FtsY [Halobacteriales archaeon]|nr:signal recognition particle-docking protein FtsY [Halobacteriales archaeon]